MTLYYDDLRLDHQAHGNLDLITIHGDLDVYDAPRLRQLAIDLESSGRRWIAVDLDHCDILDSTGLGVIVGMLRRARSRDGDIVIACACEHMLRILRMTGLTKVLKIRDTPEQALALLASLAGKETRDDA